MIRIANPIPMVRGLLVTLRHLIRGEVVTYEYPERPKPVFERYRGLHKLTRHENGLERCIGCSLCAAACPAVAIWVEGEENTPDNTLSPGERHASVYEIDELRCIFCGYCEEACPTGAVVLGHRYDFCEDRREKMIYDKQRLLEPPR